MVTPAPHCRCEVCGLWKPNWSEWEMWTDHWVPICRECHSRMESDYHKAEMLANTLPATCPRCRKEFRYKKDGPEPKRCDDCMKKFGVCITCGDSTGARVDLIKTFFCDEVRGYCSQACQWKDEASSWWEIEVPCCYQETRIDELPSPYQSRAILEGDINLNRFVYGKTGKGKTRTVLLFGRQAIERGRNFKFIRAYEFKEHLANVATSAGREGWKNWFEGIICAGILAVDEVDKIAFTKRFEVEFFELVERRTSDNRPTILISNYAVDKLASRMMVSGAPLLRRIKEFFVPINFDVEFRSELTPLAKEKVIVIENEVEHQITIA